jgi:hypothetical protein
MQKHSCTKDTKDDVDLPADIGKRYLTISIRVRAKFRILRKEAPQNPPEEFNSQKSLETRADFYVPGGTKYAKAKLKAQLALVARATAFLYLR